MKKYNVIPKDLLKDKLMYLDGHMPEQSDLFYKFGVVLSDRINKDIIPTDFYIKSEILILDLERGIRGSTGNKIYGPLTSQCDFFYKMLRKKIPDIADAVCPKDFAKRVREISQNVKNNCINNFL